MKRLDLIGQKYGRLTVESLAGQRKYHILWNCICECGGSAVVATTHLRSGHTKTCGCAYLESSSATAKKNAKHGMHLTPEYQVWHSMLGRCFNQNDKKFSLYGGRGISVCEEWRKSFIPFFEHVGYRPSNEYSLDRINGNKGYEPGNVRWATITEQNNNKSTNVRIELDGVTLTASQWARELGIPKSRIYSRIKAGWPPEKVLSKINYKKDL